MDKLLDITTAVKEEIGRIESTARAKMPSLFSQRFSDGRNGVRDGANGRAVTWPLPALQNQVPISLTDRMALWTWWEVSFGRLQNDVAVVQVAPRKLSGKDLEKGLRIPLSLQMTHT